VAAEYLFLHDVLPSAYAQGERRLFRPSGPLRILSPLWGNGNSTTLPAQPGIDMVYTYFANAWPWVLGVASGIAVIQAIAGGIQVMFSAGNKEAGVTRLTWAAAGLLLIVLSGFILRTINPLYYQ
jgi:hypothetical protein